MLSCVGGKDLFMPELILSKVTYNLVCSNHVGCPTLAVIGKVLGSGGNKLLAPVSMQLMYLAPPHDVFVMHRNSNTKHDTPSEASCIMT